ncbi:hypothetical protein TIFTF001_013200 [Ficus carica]|uniref:Uncharacterized protein n=1 Tax=Ficus carica TaxID=3494 RepID=A0AA88D2N1_FICCA|nr:hypothetical protein TIFTF001_013200 [Ficus carica]
MLKNQLGISPSILLLDRSNSPSSSWVLKKSGNFLPMLHEERRKEENLGRVELVPVTLIDRCLLFERSRWKLAYEVVYREVKSCELGKVAQRGWKLALKVVSCEVQGSELRKIPYGRRNSP